MSSAELTLYPVTGWAAVRLPGRNIMVELKYVESPEELRLESPHIVQFAMTIERATGLIEAIRQATTAPPIRQIADIRS